MSAADREAARQQGQALRKHVAVLHNMQQRETAASMCAACAAIRELIINAPDAKQCAATNFLMPDILQINHTAVLAKRGCVADCL